MENQELIKQCESVANIWATSSLYDAETQQAVKAMIESEDKTPLIDSFYRSLEFGTGGLRGIMGPGTNRMNIYTVGAATQGLSNYLNKSFKDLEQIAVVVGHDSRNNSRLFAETSANIFSANGIKVYLFEDMRPTPEMSFAIRHLGCQSGIILTASHNPKEYNGYKAYWDDGLLPALGPGAGRGQCVLRRSAGPPSTGCPEAAEPGSAISSGRCVSPERGWALRVSSRYSGVSAHPWR